MSAIVRRHPWKWSVIALAAVIIGCWAFRSLIADENLDTGRTTSLAADVINGTPYQRIKLTWGADNTATDASAANPLPVTIAAGGGVVDTELPAAAALADGASAAPTTPTVGSVPLLMNATTVDRARAVVNALDSVGTGIAASGLVGQLDDVATGTVTENQFSTVRISSRRALLVEGVASGTNMNVAVNAALPAGANVVGKVGIDQTTPGTTNGVQVVAALPAGANVIGAVTANAGTGTFTVDSELPAAAALADAASATPSTATIGAVPLLMNATTVDRARAVVNALDSVGTGIAAAGLVGQLDDVATGTVTENQFSTVRISSRRALLVEGVASGTNMNVAVNAALPAGTNIVGRVSAGPDTSNAYDGATAVTPKYAFANIAAATTDGNIVTAVGGKRIRVLAFRIHAGGTATNVTFNSKPAGAGTAISELFAAGANGGHHGAFSPVGQFQTTAGEGLTVTTGAGSTVGIGVVYVEI